MQGVESSEQCNKNELIPAPPQKDKNVWWRKVGAPYADLKPGMIDAGPSLADGASAS
jgi:hypothetical protein